MKTKHKVLVVSLAVGLFIWVIDAALDYSFFYEGSFWGLLLLEVPPHEIYMRSTMIGIFLTFGLILSSFIAECERAEQAIKVVNAELEQILNASADGICVIDKKFNVLRVNETFSTLTNLSKNEIPGKKCHEVFHSPLCNTPGCPLTRILSGEERIECEIEKELKNSSKRSFILTATPFRTPGGELIGIVENFKDLTERKQLQSQFNHAQKMESIGRLAGGIAHDFNNLLTVIFGNAELILMSITSDSQIYEDITEIKNTAECAANLTRQLLAFSRRQIIEPRVITLNDGLAEMDNMLRRLIGEDIEMVTLPTDKPWSVKVDPGQIEQVLTNLIVNARDAMPTGGKLTIETANVTLDEGYAKNHPGVTHGDYAMIAVSDSGVGMDEETLSHLFEPFYTTKEKGKGTGLGLATCYGIMKQSGGNIWVYSEKGHGTTIKIYFPRVTGESSVFSLNKDLIGLPEGTETILVAEDDPTVLHMASRILRNKGYTVIEASNGEEALQKCEKIGHSKVHLIITDVVMPQMGGKELSEKLPESCQSPKVLFVSGYPDNSIVHQGVLEPGTAFLEKPFTPATLLRKARQVLDE